MYGAIIGDMIGSPYEFELQYVKEDFSLFREDSRFTDDTVMTVAVAETMKYSTKEDFSENLVRNMQKWGRKYPEAGYGGTFYEWIYEKNPFPYHSYGNGSAMRVSPIGWMSHSLSEANEMAVKSARVTHDHPEGIRGAQAVAGSIFMALDGRSKADIRDFITYAIGYKLYKNCADIIAQHPDLSKRGVSCQETVPQALTAFLEGNSFEEVIRLAVSIGGDTDTIAAIAGSVAEAMYKIPEWMIRECRKRLPDEMLNVIDRVYHDPMGC